MARIRLLVMREEIEKAGVMEKQIITGERVFSRRQ
jgi:hypothetical protein